MKTSREGVEWSNKWIAVGMLGNTVIKCMEGRGDGRKWGVGLEVKAKEGEHYKKKEVVKNAPCIQLAFTRRR